MKILVIDACGFSCGVCVWQDGNVLAQAVEEMQRGQDARLMPMIIEALAQAKITFADIDKIAVTKGPGSFTGVRVGLATARGIGIASEKPVIGIDSFSIYKALHTQQNDLLVVIQSKRAELFCRYFPVHGMPHEACMMTQTEIDAFIGTHPGTVIKGDAILHEGDILATCAQLAAAAIAGNPEYAPCPLYLRAPDVTITPGNAA